MGKRRGNGEAVVVADMHRVWNTRKVECLVIACLWSTFSRLAGMFLAIESLVTKTWRSLLLLQTLSMVALNLLLIILCLFMGPLIPGILWEFWRIFTKVLLPSTPQCADMDSDKLSDSEELKAARMKIGQLIKVWVSNARK